MRVACFATLAVVVGACASHESGSDWEPGLSSVLVVPDSSITREIASKAEAACFGKAGRSAIARYFIGSGADARMVEFQPYYPWSALVACASGWALVRLEADPSLQLLSRFSRPRVTLIASNPPGVFDEAAVSAANSWLFAPSERPRTACVVFEWSTKPLFESPEPPTRPDCGSS